MKKSLLLLEFFWQTLSLKFLFQSLFFTASFIGVTVTALNSLNFFSILSSNYSFVSKFKISYTLFLGTFRTISAIDVIFLSIIAVLFGINLALVIQKINFIRKQSNLKLTIGAGLISLASAGCASCGLSIVSFIGIGGALALLPFRGMELYFLSIAILVVSFFYNLNAIYKACRV